MIEETKEWHAFMINASANHLTLEFPEDYHTWDAVKIHKFIDDNAWQPFEDYLAEDVYEFIEQSAYNTLSMCIELHKKDK